MIMASETVRADNQLQLSVLVAGLGSSWQQQRHGARLGEVSLQIDAGARPGLATDHRRKLVELERENRELRWANAI
jgi:aminoglycoside phosphotransferase